jgi:hypothetical protein
VQPLKLLNKTNDSQTANGVPIGMNSAIVSYFTSHNIRVMLSIGGQTYTTYWDQALSQNATQLGLNAAAVAKSLGVGIEIDYENSSSPNLPGGCRPSLMHIARSCRTTPRERIPRRG